MSDALQIENEGSLSKFIHEVDGLHDALLHEAVLLHPGYVDSDGKMFGDIELLNARLIFQSQFADILAVQIGLKRVSKFNFDARFEFQLEGEIKNQEIILYLSGKQKCTLSEIRAGEMKYKILGKEFRGSEYKLVRPD